VKIWSSDVEGTFNIEKFYQITKGREDIREFIQKFDEIVSDIPYHLRPPDAIIFHKFTKVVGGHLTYQLKDKKPKILVEANKIVMEVEKNLNISKMEMFEHPRTKVEAKKDKSKD